MKDLTFYTNPQSRGRIVRWMLEEVAAPYETVVLEYGTGMKSADYLAINPMGKVPAIRYGDAVVTEAGAICAFLADQFPERKLAPAPGSAARADYYRWMFFTAGPMEMALTARALKWEVAVEREATVGFGNYRTAVDALELAVSAGPYICGEQFTAADVYVGSCINWGLMFGTLEKREAFAGYVARLNEREAAKRAWGLDEALMAGGS